MSISQIQQLRLMEHQSPVLRSWVWVLIEFEFDSYLTQWSLKYGMKSTQRRCSGARQIGSAVGLFLACGKIIIFITTIFLHILDFGNSYTYS